MAEPLPASPDNLAAHSLEDEIRTIELRLRRGEQYVRDQRDAGGDHELLMRLEGGWIKLLRQYEILYDRLQRQSAHRRKSPDAR